MDLFAHLSACLSHFSKPPRCIVGYSGGKDSAVLLHLMRRWCLAHGIPLKAIYVHHGLSQFADRWQTHCADVCRTWHIPFVAERAKLEQRKGESLEAAAREVRYALLLQHLFSDDWLLTAHHARDQAETFLLQLMRGAGPKGLSAMPLMKPFGAGKLIRPLLQISPEAIDSYAKAHDIQWIEDDSNTDTRFKRNFLRHEILPKLESAFPGCLKTMARSAALCEATEQVAAVQIATDFIAAQTEDCHALSRSTLQQLTPIRRKMVLRAWFTERSVPFPGTSRLVEIEQMLSARPDAAPIVQWGKWQVRRSATALHLLSLHDIETFENWDVEWADCRQTLCLPGNLGQLVTTETTDAGLCPKKLKHATLTVRFRRGGERFHPAGRTGSHPLKKLFQEWNVPTWQRSRIPLVYAGNTLIAVVRYAYHADWFTQQSGLHIRMV